MRNNINYKTMDIKEVGGKAAGEAAITEFCFSARCLQEIYIVTHPKKEENRLHFRTLCLHKSFQAVTY